MTTFTGCPRPIQALQLLVFFLLMAAFIVLITIQGFRRENIRKMIMNIVILLAIALDLLLLGYAYEATLMDYVVPQLTRRIAAFPMAIHILMALLAISWGIHGFVRENKLQKSTITSKSIRAALDNLPSGLCFALENGKPVLTNRKMYALVDVITGNHLVNANKLWNDLEALPTHSEIKRIRYAGALAFILPDGSVWRFVRSEIKGEGVYYLQFIATEITEQWRLSQKLEQDNIELDKQQRNLVELLRNIIQIRQSEEILNSKIRLHDQLGHAVLATRRYLLKSLPLVKQTEIIAIWRNLTQGLRNKGFDVQGKGDVIQELTAIAKELGCTIVFEGDFPKGNRLLLDAVRESLTNAVRHAGANLLTVYTRREGGEIQVTIANNGEAIPCRITEGGGLSSLRRRVETMGGKMEISCVNGVILKIIVYEREEI
ncbi:MAG: sensor histidine kinase [Anaerovoracaceae bacterium]|jgi:signal transduction histidine kinase